LFLDIQDKVALKAFMKKEMDQPCPRKVIGEAIVYTARELRRPSKVGTAVLGGLGAAARGDKERDGAAQTADVYRSPEMLLGASWGFATDVWNMGILVGR